MKLSKSWINVIGLVFLAFLFNVGIFFFSGKQKAFEFMAGYLVELSLSVDNIFVFMLIFSYFKVNEKEQKRILFWGIMGAQFMRLIFILAGVALLNKFSWIIYIFGSFLIFTGLKLFFQSEKEEDPGKNPIIVFLKSNFPQLSTFWLVLLVVELTDVVFAVDSVPAVLAITKDPFIVYASNIFAILGLRSMYFALHEVMGAFHYLHYGLGAILIFIGVKMLLEHVFMIPVAVTLGFIAGVLFLTAIISRCFPKK